MSASHGIAARLGMLPRERERAVWIVAGGVDDIASVAPALDALAAREVRVRFIFTLTGDGDAGAFLARWTGARLWPLPFANPLSCLALLQRGNVRLTLVAGHDASLAAAHLDALARRSIPLIAMPGAGDDPAASISAAAEQVVRLVPDAATTDGQSADLTAGEAGALFAELIARDQKELRDAGSLAGRIGQAMLERVKQGRCPGLLRRRFQYLADREALNTALGHPQTIMCLGNGPSSEDAVLSSLRHDALFRVNHSWLKRGFLAKPDVVFTGGRPTLRAVEGAIFGVRTATAERAVMTVRAFRRRGGATRFFNVCNINKGLETFDWGYHRPTNGAAMVAVAVALQPARLIVAGIDMFQHPAGSYPGDSATPNAFSPGHDSERELGFLLEQFDLYQGDLVIVGDILRGHWTEFCRNRTLTG